MADLDRRGRPRFRLPVTGVTLALSGLVLAWAGVLSPLLGRPHPLPAGEPMTWWQLGIGFGVAASSVFHIEVRREAQTFTLSEVPLVLGLFFASPVELLISRVVGEGLVLILRQYRKPTKVFFNLAVCTAETLTAQWIFAELAGGRTLTGSLSWLVALAAAVGAALFSAVSVFLAIRLHDGEAELPGLLAPSLVSAACNTCLAALAAALWRTDPVALVPLAMIAGTVVVGYRGYARLHRRYGGLELLYEFTKITSSAQRPEETLQRILDEASRLLRSRRALIWLFQDGEQVPWLSLAVGSAPGEEPSASETGDPRSARPAPPLPEQIRDLVLGEGATLLVGRGSRDPVHRLALAGLGATDAIAAPLLSGGELSGVLVVADRLGEVNSYDADDGRLFATLASQAAIALENGRLIERLQEQVRAREHEAMHDALTGLPNRTLFSQALGEQVHRAREQGRRVGVLLMDLDGFKEVNDTLGHQTGDQLLHEVATRLREVTQGIGLVARLGGDEFAVLLPDLVDTQSGIDVAARLNRVISEPVKLARLVLQVGVSIGLSVCPDHGEDPTTVLQRADVAMYAAKRSRSGVTVYDPDTDWNSEVRLRLAGELRTAIREDQLEVYYQPIARTMDGKVVSAEALVRWNHPQLGRVAPDEFIPIAERTGLIQELTMRVLEDVLVQLDEWSRLGIDLSVAVNLSVQVLRDVEWPVKVATLLGSHRGSPERVVFEITESGIMTDPEYMIGVLEDLSRMGITFAIDDFGTGYSSLAYLQQLPVAKVKIDKSFVTPMADDPGAASIVRSVIDLARSLNLAVVAEGVEDQRTLDQLAAMDCHFMQGYYLSRPIPGRELAEWLLQRAAVGRVSA